MSWSPSRYIIVGKGASGKDWLLKKMVEKGCVSMKQYTTRPVRDTETGDEYHFVSEYEYKKMERRGDFISSNFYAIGWYGVSFYELMNSDVAILSPANVKDLYTKFRDTCENSTIIYLDLPDDVRRERLEHRYLTRTDDSLERRMEADEKDFKDFHLFDVRLTSVEEINNFINNFTRPSVGK